MTQLYYCEGLNHEENSATAGAGLLLNICKAELSGVRHRVLQQDLGMTCESIHKPLE